MIYEIDRDIYRIAVPLEGSPLGTLNAYWFRGPEEEFLMDTGFNTPQCEASLRGALARLGYRPERMNIINTHLHLDHTGLNRCFVGKMRRIYISDTDRMNMAARYMQPDFKRGARDSREGADEATLEAIWRAGPEGDGSRRMIFDEGKYIGLTDGQTLDVGPCVLQMISVPGHTPGNAMFYAPDRKLMFTGDHVLFDITPNITPWPGLPNALQHYLDSLEAAKRFAVSLALPGHRGGGDYYARIDEILQHHRRRLAELVSLVGERPGLTAYELTRYMRWRVHPDRDGGIPPAQLWFAAGECMSHLDKLVADGAVRRIEGEPYVTYRLP